MNPYFGFFFATTTLIIAVPTAIKVYNWLLTLWRADIHLSVPMLFSHGLHLHLRHRRADGPLPGQRRAWTCRSRARYFVVAHFHMVMGVAPLLVVFGGIYHWYPKVTGRMLDDRHRPAALLDHLRRHLPDLFPDALPGRAWACRGATTRLGGTTSSSRPRPTA
jgi:heme/copper-type cytochrome/quinol oxidase subunit 1